MTVYDIAAALPAIDVLRDRCVALAMLDAIVGGDYYTYDRESGEHEAASMRTGGGEEYDIVFTAAGVFIRGLYHESPMFDYPDGPLWPGLLDGLPEQFQPLVHRSAFCRPNGTLDATFVLWRRTADDCWHAGDGIDFSPADREEVDPDGSWLLDILCDDTVAKYVEHAEEVYQISLAAAAVEHVVALRPLTESVVRVLNFEADLADVSEKALAYRYPGSALP